MPVPFIDPLERVSTARSLLDLANEIDEIERKIADLSEQLVAYTNDRAHLSVIKQVAGEIDIRNARRIGLILAQQPSDNGGQGKEPRTRRAVRQQAGLNKDAAYRAEQVAKIDKKVFDAYVEAKRAEGKPPTVKGLKKEAMPTPGKTPLEKAFDGMRNWDRVVSKATPFAYAQIALEHKDSAHLDASYFRRIGSFLNQTADEIDRQLKQSLHVVGGRKQRGA